MSATSVNTLKIRVPFHLQMFMLGVKLEGYKPISFITLVKSLLFAAFLKLFLTFNFTGL